MTRLFSENKVGVLNGFCVKSALKNGKNSYIIMKEIQLNDANKIKHGCWRSRELLQKLINFKNTIQITFTLIVIQVNGVMKFCCQRVVRTFIHLFIRFYQSSVKIKINCIFRFLFKTKPVCLEKFDTTYLQRLSHG
jgi:hypothetical protein